MTFDADSFVVEVMDSNTIVIEAPWGDRSYVSSWHLVEERKLQLYRRHGGSAEEPLLGS